MFNATVRSVADPGEGQGNQCLDDSPPHPLVSEGLDLPLKMLGRKTKIQFSHDQLARPDCQGLLFSQR